MGYLKEYMGISGFWNQNEESNTTIDFGKPYDLVL